MFLKQIFVIKTLCIMKKMILLQVMALSLLTVQAQIKFGLKGGLNIANIGGSDVDDNKAKIGFYLGGLLEATIQDNISIQPELLYSVQGYGVELAGDDGKVNQSFLLIPVMGKYTFGSGVFVETGPQLGFLLSAKYKRDGDSENAKDDFKKSSFSWNFGLGYNNLAPNLGANVRFNLGLSRIDEDGDAQAFYRVFQIGVYYMLDGSSGGSKAKKK
jgi:hypothetical protein